MVTLRHAESTESACRARLAAARAVRAAVHRAGSEWHCTQARRRARRPAGGPAGVNTTCRTVVATSLDEVMSGARCCDAWLFPAEYRRSAARVADADRSEEVTQCDHSPQSVAL